MAYQVIDGTTQQVNAQFVLQGGNQVGVAVGGYDPTQTLIIDPKWTHSS